MSTMMCARAIFVIPLPAGHSNKFLVLFRRARAAFTVPRDPKSVEQRCGVCVYRELEFVQKWSCRATTFTVFSWVVASQGLDSRRSVRCSRRHRRSKYRPSRQSALNRFGYAAIEDSLNEADNVRLTIVVDGMHAVLQCAALGVDEMAWSRVQTYMA